MRDSSTCESNRCTSSLLLSVPCGVRLSWPLQLLLLLCVLSCFAIQMTARKGCSAGCGPSHGQQESYNLTAPFDLFILHSLTALFFTILNADGSKLRPDFVLIFKPRTVKSALVLLSVSKCQHHSFYNSLDEFPSL